MGLCLGCATFVVTGPATRVSPAQQSKGVEKHDAGTEPAANIIEPDPVVQNEIDRIMGVFTQVDESSQDDELVRFLRQWEDIESRRGADVLVPQLIYYSLERDVPQSMAFEIAVATLNMVDRLEEERVVPILLRYLPNSDEAQSRKIERHLRRYEDWRNGRPDFATYTSILSGYVRKGEPLPRDLIQYMYDAHAGEAVLAIRAAHAGELAADDVRAIRWAEHEVSDVLWKWQHGFLPTDQVEQSARDALLKLAVSGRWWVRRYVAEIMLKHPPFRDEAVLDQFEGDTDESVRTIAATIRAG